MRCVSETKADGKVVSSTFARGNGRRNLGRWGLRCARADGAVIPPTFYQPPLFHRNTSGPCGMSRNVVRMVIVSLTTASLAKTIPAAQSNDGDGL